MLVSLFACTLACCLTAWGVDAAASAEQGETVKRWTFDREGDHEGWGGFNGLTDMRVREGVLRTTVSGRDPFISISGLDIPARPWNVFRARLRIVQDEPLGQRGGELFYSNSSVGLYGGYSQDKTSQWTAPEANAWEVVSIYPFWSREGKIIQLRLDFPAPSASQLNRAAIEIDWIELADLKLESQPEITPSWDIKNGAQDNWESPMFSLDTGKIGNWLTIRASADAPRDAEFSWMNERGVFASATIRLKPADTGMVNLDLSNSRFWQGHVHQFKLRSLPDSTSDSAVTFHSLAVNPRPQGPASIDILFSGIEDAIVRAGYETAFFLDLVNCGGEDAPALAFDHMRLPRGVSLRADSPSVI